MVIFQGFNSKILKNDNISRLFNSKILKYDNISRLFNSKIFKYDDFKVVKCSAFDLVLKWLWQRTL